MMHSISDFLYRSVMQKKFLLIWETQDNILSQDFGSFFNEAYPLPELGSPLHNYTEAAAPGPILEQAAKSDLIKKVDAAKEGEEVVPADKGKMLSCNKIW